MSTVLITGGAGYIGSHAVYAFLDAGYEVVVLDDLSTGVRENLPSRISFYKGDVADRDLLQALLRDHQIGGVLHFAGSVVVSESVAFPEKYYRNNTSRGLELADFLISQGIRRFLFSSTAAVYGIPDRVPVTEKSPLKPINPYGWSKLFFEQQLKDLSAAHGLNYGILRYFNVAGSDPGARTGQSTPLATHLIKVACEVAAGKRASMQVFGTDYDTPDGTCIRDFIHVTDLARAHVAVYEYLQSSSKNVIFNCGNGKGHSVLEVLRAVEKAIGRRLTTEPAQRRPGDPPALVADSSALCKTLGWRAQFGLDDMVSTALAWERRIMGLAQDS